ncbi:UNVERIFIED_CONTAM: hypothetical protein NCL1_40321 [Trichonephila clavipes]
MAEVQDLKSSLLYALKLEDATQASRRNHQFIRGARVTLDDQRSTSEPRETQLQVLGMRWNGTPEKKLSPIKRKYEITVSSLKQEN